MKKELSLISLSDSVITEKRPKFKQTLKEELKKMVGVKYSSWNRTFN